MQTQTQQFLPAVPLSEIAESPTNPRKLFDGQALEELAQSIREHGVMQPVLLRRLDGVAASNPVAVYELVFGHRRVRAAMLADLATVPALVVEMTDAQALEAQVLENCQRADVTPIEEAEGYLALHLRHGLPVAELAAKVGKSEAHVYQRMKLAELPEAARNAVAAGKMALTVALALARISNPELRTKAAEEVLEEKPRTFWDHDVGEEVETVEAMPTDKALRFLRARYTLRMSEATWDLADAELVPRSGACSKCPKCSSNAPLLFPELESAHALCSDPDCYAAKRTAAWERRKAELEEKGRKVIDGKAAEKIVSYYGVKPSCGYVETTTICHEDPKGRTWGQILGKGAASVVALDETGREHQLIPDDVVSAKKKELAAERRASPEERKRDEEQERAEFESDVKHLAAELTVAKCVEAAEAVDADEARIWKTCAELLLSEGGYRAEPLHTAKRRGLFDAEKSDNRLEVFQNLRQWLRTVATPAQIRGLVLELLMEEEGRCFDIWGGGGPECLAQVAQDFAVDDVATLREARRKVTAERKAAEKAKAEKK
ncbi:MAG TPA: ParB/RepB/Spo0J family partition protein, partial [Thermoanaerobaculia bacterium]|nr:ParB/RepB/Spo0J family partition protein [Thermoanaerobaculia bacterium]